MRDFMLHLHLDAPPGAGPSLPRRAGKLLEQIQACARSACPAVQWGLDLDFGTSDHVRIFSAPDYESALKVENLAKEVDGVRAEVMPLRPGARR